MKKYIGISGQAPRGWGPVPGVQATADFIRAAGLPSPRLPSGPPPYYDPRAWADATSAANCYGYAMNVRSWLHLGHIARRAMPETVCVRFNKAVSDGLHPAPLDDPPDIRGHYLTALVDGCGWHWYRKDASGYWSHKEGLEPVTNLDRSGCAIRDPKIADRGPYHRFIGYFYVPY